MFFESLNYYTKTFIYPCAIIILFLLIYFIIVNWNSLCKYFSKIDKKTWLILSLITIVGLLFRIIVNQFYHIILYDEMWYIEGAKNLIESGNLGEYSKSIGWPFLMSMLFRIVGVGSMQAIILNLIIGVLTIPLFFLMTYILTKNKIAGLIAGIFLAFNPIHIRWSTASETNIASLFFVVLSILLFFFHIENKKNRLLSLMLFLSSLGFATMIRPENYLLIIVFGIIYLAYEKDIFKNTLKKILPWSIMIVTLPNLFQVVVFHSSVNWVEKTGGQGSNFGIINILYNSWGLLGILNPFVLSLLISISFLFGLRLIKKKKPKQFVFFILYIVLFFILHTFSYYQAISNPSRVALIFYPAIFVISAYLIARISKGLSKRRNINLMWILVVVALLCLPNYIVAFDMEKDNHNKLMTKIPSLVNDNIPNDCLLVANWPTLLIGVDNEVIDTEIFFENSEKIIRQNKCVMFYSDITCNKETEDMFVAMKKTLCEKISEKFEMTPYKTYSVSEGKLIIKYSFFSLQTIKLAE